MAHNKGAASGTEENWEREAFAPTCILTSKAEVFHADTVYSVLEMDFQETPVPGHGRHVWRIQVRRESSS